MLVLSFISLECFFFQLTVGSTSELLWSCFTTPPVCNWFINLPVMYSTKQMRNHTLSLLSLVCLFGVNKGILLKCFHWFILFFGDLFVVSALALVSTEKQTASKAIFMGKLLTRNKVVLQVEN